MNQKSKNIQKNETQKFNREKRRWIEFYLINEHSAEYKLDKEIPKEEVNKNRKIFIKYLI